MASLKIAARFKSLLLAFPESRVVDVCVSVRTRAQCMRQLSQFTKEKSKWRRLIIASSITRVCAHPAGQSSCYFYSSMNAPLCDDDADGSMKQLQ